MLSVQPECALAEIKLPIFINFLIIVADDSAE